MTGEMITELIERMNDKKICMFESNFGESSFEFDISNHSILHVVSEENNLIAVTLGQQVVYSIDISEMNVEIYDEEDHVEVLFRKNRDVEGVIIFRFID